MKILISGEGGQGVQMAAEILAYAGFLENKDSSFIPNFGVEQRGGVSLAFVVVGPEAGYPKFETADFLIIMCHRACVRVGQYIGTKTKIIYGPDSQGENALKTNLPARVGNILALGKILALSGVVSKETLEKALKAKLKDKFTKDPGLEKLNLEALNEGFQA